jgi:hypothetical protein
MISFKRIKYEEINARQKEIFNFQKVSGLLADFGYATYRLTDDWNGADFLAIPFSGKPALHVQLKGRLSFAKKYKGKELWVCFRSDGYVYLYPHDELLNHALEVTSIGGTDSWTGRGAAYTFPSIPKNLTEKLKGYCLGHESDPASQP